jgi:hypothetical protein
MPGRKYGVDGLKKAPEGVPLAGFAAGLFWQARFGRHNPFLFVIMLMKYGGNGMEALRKCSM